jgi:glycosyltransferase involved in cell wall biosynthesis
VLDPYDIVIATRNRAESLALALPWMVRQVPPPARVVVVDSSDDPAAVEPIVRDACAAADVPYRVVRTAPGSSHQRNVGLAHVTAPVVFFPDDDAIFYPGAAQAILRVYARDHDRVLGAVSGADMREAPPGFDPAAHRIPRMARLRRLIHPVRSALEGRLIPDPFIVHAAEQWASPATPEPPPWLAELNAIREPFMRGFRMTFRTEVIRRAGFDERLGRYATSEDTDASLAVLDRYLIARALDAGVYHHTAPGARAGSRSLGVMHILNRAYIVCKHSAPGSKARAAVRRFSYYKALLYALGAATRAGRERLGGSLDAIRSLPRLEAAAPSELGETYTRLIRAAQHAPECRGHAPAEAPAER